MVASTKPFGSARLFPQKLAILACAGLLLLGGCSKPVEKTEDVRPVRVMKLESGNIDTVAEFSGDVRARYESRLGFRVGGKIVARKVEVGSVVKRGQVLMQLDPQDLQLAQAQANAALKAAESNRDLARAELKRYQDLREKNFVSQAVLDSKETAFKAAQASYDQAVAGYRNQSNQAGYAVLHADADGIVTSIDAEAGQVVAAGAPVVRLAQGGEREIVIGIPEDRVEDLRRVTDVRVRTWAERERIIPGKIREISPVADPVTRTYTAKVSIPASAENVKLGMTAYVAFAAKSANAAMRLPLTALFQDKSNTAVWVVENGTVRLAPVQVAGTADNDILVSGGVAPGQTVVTAGVNLLKSGQKVKILGEEVAVSAASGSSAGAAK
ncbi:efflux RND transporter periplasmic adaptor subunit [Noviherbaspirillum sp. CPCC 100848]|uniref:Efflux RND transporter periplasmic adaptor subunit n=1 Tax=Noviherbaspirillum album TaxID=3080276 RepID=A0ABU6JFG4_9BURK|nr:efflux RND transporter periplasmic adaptor subunit [Noviherbaspirillum sp. CPCC 100848]MEC4721829.1 efflux RND transporter periplasmic adaptor subunit [Noviherbaspirillum sp. CPCC 100848]